MHCSDTEYIFCRHQSTPRCERILQCWIGTDYVLSDPGNVHHRRELYPQQMRQTPTVDDRPVSTQDCYSDDEMERIIVSKEQTESSCPSSGQIYPAHETDLFILYQLPAESLCLGREASLQSMSCQDPETKLMTLKPIILSSQQYC